MYQVLNLEQIKKRRKALLRGADFIGERDYWRFIEDLIETVTYLESRIEEMGEVGIQNDELKRKLAEMKGLV